MKYLNDNSRSWGILFMGNSNIEEEVEWDSILFNYIKCVDEGLLGDRA